MVKKIVLAAVIVTLLLCVALVGIPFVYNLTQTQPLAEVADVFMAALRDGNYAKAFDLCSATFKSHIGSAEDLEQYITENDLRPISWEIHNRDVNDSDRDSNNLGTVTGAVTFTEDRHGTLSLLLIYENGQWLINDFDLHVDP